MREEEKIFLGKLFDARTQELRDIKHKAHILCQKFNSMDEYDEDRLPIIKEFIGKIGDKYYFQGPIQFNYGSHTFIGENFFSNFNLTVMDDARIYIGDNVMFGPNVTIDTATHPVSPDLRKRGAQYNKKVYIEENVWLGAGVIVLPGVRIGKNSVIGAGSLVTKDIPDNVVAFGTPCMVKRKINDSDFKTYDHGKKIDLDEFI